MIDTSVRNVPGEYARMLVVLHAAFAFVWSIYCIPAEPAAAWMAALCPIAALRGFGPVGTGLWRPLFTMAVLSAALCAAIAFRSSGFGAAAMALLVLLTLKLATETQDGDTLRACDDSPQSHSAN